MLLHAMGHFVINKKHKLMTNGKMEYYLVTVGLHHINGAILRTSKIMVDGALEIITD